MTRYKMDGVGEIETLMVALEERWKEGKDLTVAVKSAGGQPAIDIRVSITSDAYPEAFEIEDKNTWLKSRGKKPLPTRETGYVGPTKQGMWLDVEMAERVGTAILEAVEHARSRERDTSCLERIEQDREAS